jgi:hypothetical protein
MKRGAKTLISSRILNPDCFYFHGIPNWHFFALRKVSLDTRLDYKTAQQGRARSWVLFPTLTQTQGPDTESPGPSEDMRVQV